MKPVFEPARATDPVYPKPKLEPIGKAFRLLTECPNCGKRYLESLKACPHCKSVNEDYAINNWSMSRKKRE